MLNIKNTNNTDHRPLKLYQLNTNKSFTVHLCLLHQIYQDDDMILIQEPYISKQGKSRAMQGWITMYPTGHNQDPSQMRAIMLVNWAISTNSWSSVPLNSQDAVAINLQAPAESIIIVNIYSDGESVVIWKTIDKLFREYAAKWHDGQGLPYQFICARDFNAHHPLWDEPCNSHLFTDQALACAEHLLQLIGYHCLKMPLPALVLTLWAFSTGNYMHVNNMFCSDELLPAFTKYIVNHAAQPPYTNHFPILSTINVSSPQNSFEPWWNFWKIEWLKFYTKLREKLDALPAPCKIETTAQMYRTLDDIDQVV